MFWGTFHIKIYIHNTKIELQMMRFNLCCRCICGPIARRPTYSTQKPVSLSTTGACASVRCARAYVFSYIWRLEVQAVAAPTHMPCTLNHTHGTRTFCSKSSWRVAGTPTSLINYPSSTPHITTSHSVAVQSPHRNAIALHRDSSCRLRYWHSR